MEGGGQRRFVIFMSRIPHDGERVAFLLSQVLNFDIGTIEGVSCSVAPIINSARYGVRVTLVTGIFSDAPTVTTQSADRLLTALL
jgi:hypothetical protein